MKPRIPIFVFRGASVLLLAITGCSSNPSPRASSEEAQANAPSSVDPYVQERQQQALQHRQQREQQEAGNSREDSADGPWVPRILALTAGNAEAAGQSDGFNVVTQYVVKFAYTGGSNYEMQAGLQDFKSTALAGYDMLAAKHNVDTNVYSAYRRGWISGFDANARTATLTTN